MLLAEYDSLSREGKIGNTYEAGQLNIIRYLRPRVKGILWDSDSDCGLFAMGIQGPGCKTIKMGYSMLWGTL